MLTVKEKMSKVIEKAGEMPENESIYLSFNTAAERKSGRSQLYNAKKLYSRTFPEKAEKIKIRNITSEGKLILQICKENPITFGIFKADENGIKEICIHDKDEVPSLPVTKTQENFIASRLKKQLAEEGE